MDTRTGIYRIKVVWAALFGAAAVACIGLLLLGQTRLDPLHWGLLCAAGYFGARAPLMDMSLKNKVVFGVGAPLLALVSFGKGERAEVEAYMTALVLALVGLWAAWTAAAWIVDGFRSGRRG